MLVARFSGDLVEHARAFEVLAAELDVPSVGAFERAASKLHLDTSVLRRRMQSLAEYAGGALVSGRGRALRLTPLGARVRTLASDLVERARAMQTHERPLERIVVGCTEAIGEMLPIAVAELRRRPSSARVVTVIRRLGTEECISRMLAGEVDVGVVRGAVHETRFPRELEATLLGRDRLWIASRASHPLARLRTLRLRDIARTPLVLYGPGSATRRRVMSALAPVGTTSIVLEVDGRTTALAAAREGVGVAFLSLLPRCAPRASGIRLRDVTRLFPPSAFWLLLPQTPSPTAVALGRLLLRHAHTKQTLPL